MTGNEFYWSSKLLPASFKADAAILLLPNDVVMYSVYAPCLQVITNRNGDGGNFNFNFNKFISQHTITNIT